LLRFLDGVREEPLLLSDGFPAGYLPRPLVPPRRPAQSRGPSKSGWLKELEQEKRLRNQPWVPVELFLEVRGRLSEATLLDALKRLDTERLQPGLARHRVAHNTINRLTGTTPPAGGLYFIDEYWPRSQAGARWEVYVRSGRDAGWLEKMFNLIGEFGYGKDASLGRGRFRATVTEAERRLFDSPGNRFMSLSHGSLTTNMREPRYRLETHYGKLGGERAVTGVETNGQLLLAPFKYPLSLLKPGATFAPGDAGPFGELLVGVHNVYSDIVHNAWHLAVPYTEVQDE